MPTCEIEHYCPNCGRSIPVNADAAGFARGALAALRRAETAPVAVHGSKEDAEAIWETIHQTRAAIVRSIRALFPPSQGEPGVCNRTDGPCDCELPDGPAQPAPKRPTIAELEAILSSTEAPRLEFLPNGEVRAAPVQPAPSPGVEANKTVSGHTAPRCFYVNALGRQCRRYAGHEPGNHYFGRGWRP